MCSRQNGRGSKLIQRAAGSYCIISTTCQSLAIDHDEIPNTISPDRAVLAPDRMHPQDCPVDDEQQTLLSFTPKKNQAESNDHLGQGANDESMP